MARKTYKLSDETYEVLKNHEQGTAKEMECDPSYIYGIRNQINPDPYPKFRELYRAAAADGAPVHIWLNDLKSISNRGQRIKVEDFYTGLIKKIESDAESTERIVEALKDGTIDKPECLKIADSLQKMGANLESLKSLVQLKLGELDAQNVRVM